jgi:O-acetyl-ADP-ribose deacetylase (regulator of RNase III)
MKIEMKVLDITKTECDGITNPIGHKYQFKGGACTAIVKAFGS